MRAEAIQKKKLVYCILLMLGLFCLSGCSKDSTRVVFTTGFGKDEVFRIEGESCRLPEIMVYLTTIQNQYEAVYGEQIWEASLDGVTLEENIKETVLARIAQVKTMYLLAQDRGITLDEKEEQKVQQAAEEYFNSLNETEISAMGVTKDIIEKLYREYALAEKVYHSLIADINPEISDDEARIITIQQIVLKTATTDGSGKKVEYSQTAREEVYAKAEELQRQAAAGESDFTELASRYSDSPEITLSFGKGEVEAVLEEAAFNLETGEVSRVITCEDCYRIIRCVSTFNREETDANKLKIVEIRRKETFGQEYDAFVSTLARKLNQSLWDQVELIHEKQVTTDSFFKVYEKYFPEQTESF